MEWSLDTAAIPLRRCQRKDDPLVGRHVHRHRCQETAHSNFLSTTNGAEPQFRLKYRVVLLNFEHSPRRGYDETTSPVCFWLTDNPFFEQLHDLWNKLCDHVFMVDICSFIIVSRIKQAALISQKVKMTKGCGPADQCGWECLAAEYLWRRYQAFDTAACGEAVSADP